MLAWFVAFVFGLAYAREYKKTQALQPAAQGTPFTIGSTWLTTMITPLHNNAQGTSTLKMLPASSPITVEGPYTGGLVPVYSQINNDVYHGWVLAASLKAAPWKLIG